MAKLIRFTFAMVYVGGLMACSQPSTTAPDSEVFQRLGQQNHSGIKVEPGVDIVFPRDHGLHGDFAIEWWYLTANLRDNDGKPYPLQWTQFRFLGNHGATPWASQQQFMAHAKIANAEKSWFAERFARGGVGNAAVIADPLQIYLDDWQWMGDTQALTPASLNFSIRNEASATLRISANKAPVKQGEQGFSQKLPNAEQASYYYSQPYLQLNGTLRLDGQEIEVSGPGWFDHEWTSHYLVPGAEGWDWFALHLDGDQKLMLFRMRRKGQEDFWSGTLFDQDGAAHPIESTMVDATVSRRVSVRGVELPLHWRITIPSLNLDISLSPFKQDQWNEGMFSYYEGAIFAEGTHTGQGFMELTGYSKTPD